MPTNRGRSQRQSARPTQQKPFEPHARQRSDDANAFLPDPDGGLARAPEELAESLAEEFVEAATSGEDRDEEVLDASFPEELGGPFVETGPGEELAGSADDVNPPDAEREPLPRPVAGLVTEPDIDDRLDEQVAGASADEHVSADDGGQAAPPDPARNVDELNEEPNGGRTPA
jgi:hypothetical protein